MSLLLDALKKAAEQKAQKSQSEPSSDRNSDETLLDVPEDDASLFARESEKGLSSGSYDQTELETRLEIEQHEQESSARDATETHYEQTQAEMPAGDDTRIDTADATETRYEQTRVEMPAGDDSNIDTADATETRYEQTRVEMPAGDDTRIDTADATETRYEQTRVEMPAGDDTRIDTADATETRYEQTQAEMPAGDDTRIDTADATEIHYEQTQAEMPAGDDTRIDTADATETRYEQTRVEMPAGDDSNIDTADGTETRYEQTQAEMPAGDDTRIDTADATETRYEQTQAEMPAGDEPRIDTADETETRYEQTQAEMPAGDEPRIDTADETETRYEQTQAEMPAGDATDIEMAEIAASPGVAASEKLQIGDDETDLSELAGSDDLSTPSHAEETDLSQPMGGELSFEESPPGNDDTDLSQPSSFAEQILAAQAQQQADEDLSLMLIEPEPSSHGADADSSFTDSQILQNRNAASADQGLGLEELSLQDNTETRDPRERIPKESGGGEHTDTQAPTLTSPTGTAIDADDTRTSHSVPTIARVDSTSTRTYAPDNYDRTLMKLPSDDASKIFAGMKSDPDVVMTPDYAKKVFRSKTSTQRTQHYKLYAGIAVVIMLSVSMFGLFQYQDESEQIDDSLRALKRDPMPGIIKAAQPEKTELFSEIEVLSDARTIEIIETANQMESIPEVEASVTQSDAVDEAPALQEEQASSETGIVASELPAQVQPKQVLTNQAPANQGDIDQLASLASSAPSVSGSDGIREDSAEVDRPGNLQITTSNEYRQADIWLGEAYAAYRVGNNELALARYDQVLDVDPANRNALLARAAIRMQDGQIKSAIKDYQALLLANPADSHAMSSLLAVADYSPRETESQLKLMIRDDPQSPYLHFALANAYGAQKRWQEAQRHYFTALQNNPDDPNYAYNLAVSLEHISQPSTAITYYQRALDNFTNGLATFNRDIVNQRLEMLGQL